MSIDEAKFLLSAYRPDGRDAEDPHFAEALRMASLDPELGRWFEEQLSFDRAFQSSLSMLQPPQHLMSSLLAGVRIGQRRPWWRRPMLVAAAALTALTVMVSVWLAGQRDAESSKVIAEFRQDMVEKVVALDRLDLMSPDASAVRKWLAAHEGHADAVIPPGLSAAMTVGCRILEWHGRKVTLICFQSRPDSPGPDAHLLVMDGDAFDGAATAQPLIAQSGGWATAVWRRGNRAYMLASPRDAASLREMLGDVI